MMIAASIASAVWMFGVMWLYARAENEHRPNPGLVLSTLIAAVPAFLVLLACS